MSPEPCLVFVHVPKTTGTTLNALLFRVYPPRNFKVGVWDGRTRTLGELGEVGERFPPGGPRARATLPRPSSRGRRPPCEEGASPGRGRLRSPRERAAAWSHARRRRSRRTKWPP